MCDDVYISLMHIKFALSIVYRFEHRAAPCWIGKFATWKLGVWNLTNSPWKLLTEQNWYRISDPLIVYKYLLIYVYTYDMATNMEKKTRIIKKHIITSVSVGFLSERRFVFCLDKPGLLVFAAAAWTGGDHRARLVDFVCGASRVGDVHRCWGLLISGLWMTVQAVVSELDDLGCVNTHIPYR